MRILITGHKGFIGSLLWNKLGGHELVGIDLKEGQDLLTCPLPDVDLVYHLAAQSSVEGSWKDPVHDSMNLPITVRLAHAYPKAKIIYAASAASLDIQSPYGFSKDAAWRYLHTFHPRAVGVRFANVYGEGSKSVVDIFKKQDTVTIYGDGLQTRDFVHVYDVIEGLVKAEKWDAGMYSLGTGIATTVLSLAKGKQKVFAPARKETRDAVLWNDTPDWKAKIMIDEYLYA